VHAVLSLDLQRKVFSVKKKGTIRGSVGCLQPEKKGRKVAKA